MEQIKPKPPLERRLKYAIKDFLKSPLVYNKRYNFLVKTMNYIVEALRKEEKDDEAKRVRLIAGRMNVIQSWLLQFPIGLGSLSSLILFIAQGTNYHTIASVGSAVFSGFPLSSAFLLLYKYLTFNYFKFLIPALIGYFVSCVITKIILNKNPFLIKQEQIEAFFTAYGHVDLNGKPWKAVWTEEAIFIEAYHANVSDLHEQKKFWTAINFTPDSPIVDEEERGRAVYPKVRYLPKNIKFELPTEIKIRMLDNERRKAVSKK